MTSYWDETSLRNPHVALSGSRCGTVHNKFPPKAAGRRNVGRGEGADVKLGLRVLDAVVELLHHQFLDDVRGPVRVGTTSEILELACEGV